MKRKRIYLYALSLIMAACNEKSSERSVVLEKEIGIPESLRQTMTGAQDIELKDTIGMGATVVHITANIIRNDSVALIKKISIKGLEADYKLQFTIENTPINRGSLSAPAAAISGVVYFEKKTALRTQSIGRFFTVAAKTGIIKN